MYTANDERYDGLLRYNVCGKSGIVLPQIALGLWHNFGDVNNHEEAHQMIYKAFDNGITHFDLANNYGVPYGSAETNFGKLLANDLKPYRNELVISSKAGHYMWPGPYGDGGSRKYLMTSIDDTLRRLQTNYVDIFYSHRYDPNTPLEETMRALADIVHQGKALYIGLSKYPTDKLQEAINLLRYWGTPLILYQDRYSIFARNTEFTTMPIAHSNELGFIGFSPLAQGLLSDKYIHGIPANSRAGQSFGFLKSYQITEDKIDRVKRLNAIANERGQTLSQMALAWTLSNPMVTSMIIGASSVKQLSENIEAVKNLHFSKEEMWLIGEQAIL